MPDHDDALMAAITGDRPAPGTDPRELSAAEADVDALCRQLKLMGDKLTEEEPQRPPVRRRSRRRLVLALAATAASVLLGTGWLLSQLGGSGNESADTASSAASGQNIPLGEPSYLACMAVIVEGDVTAVRGTQVTLEVTRAYKSSPGTVTFTSPQLATGDHVLVALQANSPTPSTLLVGETRIAPERPLLTEGLKRAAGAMCH